MSGPRRFDVDPGRERFQTGPTAREKLAFCIGQLEDADELGDTLHWRTPIVEGLTVEELVGAIVHAHDELAKWEGGRP